MSLYWGKRDIHHISSRTFPRGWWWVEWIVWIRWGSITAGLLGIANHSNQEMSLDRGKEKDRDREIEARHQTRTVHTEIPGDICVLKQLDIKQFRSIKIQEKTFINYCNSIDAWCLTLFWIHTRTISPPQISQSSFRIDHSRLATKQYDLATFGHLSMELMKASILGIEPSILHRV